MTKLMPLVAIAAALAASPAFAADPAPALAFVPITLDVNRATELVDGVPMVTQTRAQILALIQRWEQEAVAQKAKADADAAAKAKTDADAAAKAKTK